MSTDYTTPQDKRPRHERRRDHRKQQKEMKKNIREIRLDFLQVAPDQKDGIKGERVPIRGVIR